MASYGVELRWGGELDLRWVSYSATTGGKIKARSIGAIYLGLWLIIVLGKLGVASIS